MQIRYFKPSLSVKQKLIFNIYIPRNEIYNYRYITHIKLIQPLSDKRIFVSKQSP